MAHSQSISFAAATTEEVEGKANILFRKQKHRHCSKTPLFTKSERGGELPVSIILMIDL